MASADPKLHFIVHARKAWLNGVNPRENRRVPPLMYDYVYKISKARPSLEFTLNGGLNTVPIVKQVLEEFPGKIMIGRAFYDNPLFIYDLLQGNILACFLGVPFIS